MKSISSPSTSLAEIVIVKNISSAISVSCKASSVGGSFTEITVSVHISESPTCPSLTVTIISTSPYQFSSGIKRSVSPLSSVETSGPNGVAPKMSISSSTSTAERTISKGMSSSVNCEPISSNAGASFTGLTVNSNVSESVRNPSLTVTRIFTVPL